MILSGPALKSHAAHCWCRQGISWSLAPLEEIEHTLCGFRKRRAAVLNADASLAAHCGPVLRRIRSRPDRGLSGCLHCELGASYAVWIHGLMGTARGCSLWREFVAEFSTYGVTTIKATREEGRRLPPAPHGGRALRDARGRPVSQAN